MPGGNSTKHGRNAKAKAQTIHSIVLQHPEVSGIGKSASPSLKSRKEWARPTVPDYGAAALLSRAQPYQPNQKKTQAIKYDFNDPVLNKEFRQAAMRYNQMNYRLKNDPNFAKQVQNAVYSSMQTLDQSAGGYQESKEGESIFNSHELLPG